jgi:hypothetical protein
VLAQVFERPAQPALQHPRRPRGELVQPRLVALPRLDNVPTYRVESMPRAARRAGGRSRRPPGWRRPSASSRRRAIVNRIPLANDSGDSPISMARCRAAGRVRIQQQHPQPQRCLPCPVRDSAQQQRVVQAEQAEPPRRRARRPWWPAGRPVDQNRLSRPYPRPVPHSLEPASRQRRSPPPVRPPRPRMPGVPRNPVTGQARPSSRAASWSHTA